jgi:hypothetical protein
MVFFIYGTRLTPTRWHGYQQVLMEALNMTANTRKPPPINDDDPDVYWTFDELKRRGIVSGHSDLHTKKIFYGFPHGVRLAGKKLVWRRTEVIAWLRKREAEATGYHSRGRPKANPDGEPA